MLDRAIAWLKGTVLTILRNDGRKQNVVTSNLLINCIIEQCIRAVSRNSDCGGPESAAEFNTRVFTLQCGRTDQYAMLTPVYLT